jgi:hypothetical protein
MNCKSVDRPERCLLHSVLVDDAIEITECKLKLQPSSEPRSQCHLADPDNAVRSDAFRSLLGMADMRGLQAKPRCSVWRVLKF